jgi:hypothetical protein
MLQSSPSLQQLQPDQLIVMRLEHSLCKVMKDVAAYICRECVPCVYTHIGRRQQLQQVASTSVTIH